MASTVSTVCALYQTLRPFSRFSCSCTDRETIWWSIAKTAADWEGRNFPITSAWVMSNLVKTDCLNCETATTNRTLQTGSLTVPADGDRTVRLKLLTGPFTLGHLLYRQMVIGLIVTMEIFEYKDWEAESEKRNEWNHDASTPRTFRH